jgi:hypothetical protein
MRHGSDSAKAAELWKSVDDIETAITINPDAHFGRETVQLQLINWLAERAVGYQVKSLANTLLVPEDNLWGPTDPKVTKQIKGMVGLIVLGSGWENPDLFRALEVQVNPRRYNGGQKLACFVSLRTQELIDQGKLPFEPDGYEGMPPVPSNFDDGQAIKREFGRLRKEAEAWQQQRTAFMMARLKAGRHPDTDPHFWDGYVEPPAPKVEYSWLESRTIGEKIGLALGAVCLIPIVFFVVAVFVDHRRRRRNEVIILG